MSTVGWSGLILEVAEVIGPENALKLWNQFAGISLYVPTPQGMHGRHRITLCVGLEAATKLAAHFKGVHLDIPSKFHVTSKKAQIVADLEAAVLNNQEIAAKHSVTCTYVRGLRATHGLPVRSSKPPVRGDAPSKSDLAETQGSVEQVAHSLGCSVAMAEQQLAPLRPNDWRMRAAIDIRDGRGSVQEIAARYRCKEAWVKRWKVALIDLQPGDPIPPKLVGKLKPAVSDGAGAGGAERQAAPVAA